MRRLILAKETGAVDNASLRSTTGLDTLSASQTLRRLHHQYNLLVKSGAGSSTYYQLTPPQELPLFAENYSNTGDLYSNTGDLEPTELSLPLELIERIDALSPKARKEKLWPVIVWLCALKPFKAEGLAVLLDKQINHFKGKHLNKIREEEKLIQYIYPDVQNHPEQAYIATDKGRKWLQQQGILLDDS